MSNKYTNFYYDPQREGYDLSVWRTINGEPTVGANQLRLSLASVVHYSDIWRGDVTMNLNIPVPASGARKNFGLIQLNKNAYLYFDITNDVFSAKTSDGTTSTSSTITWQSSWSSVSTDFRIKWEAGTAKFFVGGVQQAATSDASIPGDPLSFYINNGNVDTITLKYIQAKGIQTFFLHEALEDSSTEPLIFESESLTIAEAVTMSPATTMASNVNDALAITESQTMAHALDMASNVNDALTITESVTSAHALALSSSVNDTLAITEDVTMLLLAFSSVSDSLTITESVTILPLLDVIDALTITESVTVGTPA